MITCHREPVELAALRGRVRFTHLLPDVVFGDAVSNDCLEIARTVRGWGFVSPVYGERIDPLRAPDVRPMAEYREVEAEVVVFHFSTWSETAEWLVRHGRRNVVLIYHNLTPEEYFHGGNPQAADNVRRARLLLPELARVSLLGLGVSEYNRRELVDAGFDRTDLLPILLSWRDLDGPADAGILKRLADGRANLLTVGRLAPNKGIDDVLKLFYRFHQLHAESRLLLVGPDTVVPRYREWLDRLAEHLGIREDVEFAGRVDLAAWRAHYRSAHVYLCMSEHEGFCVPLVEAMQMGIPVVAYAAAAVPETLGDAGVLLHRKDPVLAAEVVDMLCRDAGLRARLIGKGRERAATFARPRVESLLARQLKTACELAGLAIPQGRPV